jgi:hypothetical protein
MEKAVRTIEFDSFVEGNVIRVPRRYRNIIAVGNAVKVVVFSSDSEPVVAASNEAGNGEKAWPEEFINLFGSVDDETFAVPEAIPWTEKALL